MPALALSTAIVNMDANPRAKRRLVQNTGANAAYFTNNKALTQAEVRSEGIRLPGGVDAVVLFEEGKNSPAEPTFWTTADGETTTIRYLDTE